MPELRRLRYFLAVADELNFSRAAQRLHVAQSALSRQIGSLEQELGVALLVRTTHDVALTEAGHFLHRRGRDLIADAEELWRSVRSFAGGEHGAMIVAFGTSAGYETAPRLIEAIRAKVPQLAISTRVLSQSEILDGVAGGMVDAGIVRTPPDAPGLESRLLRAERQGVLLRRGHQLATADTVRLEQLDGECLLLHRREANPRHYDAVLGLYERAGLTPEVLVRELAADLTYAPIVDGRAISIAGESVASALPGMLCWVPLIPVVCFDVRLVARWHDRPPALERLLTVAFEAADRLGWLDPSFRLMTGPIS